MKNINKLLLIVILIILNQNGICQVIVGEGGGEVPVISPQSGTTFPAQGTPVPIVTITGKNLTYRIGENNKKFIPYTLPIKGLTGYNVIIKAEGNNGVAFGAAQASYNCTPFDPINNMYSDFMHINIENQYLVPIIITNFTDYDIISPFNYVIPNVISKHSSARTFFLWDDFESNWSANKNKEINSIYQIVDEDKGYVPFTMHITNKNISYQFQQKTNMAATVSDIFGKAASICKMIGQPEISVIYNIISKSLAVKVWFDKNTNNYDVFMATYGMSTNPIFTRSGTKYYNQDGKASSNAGYFKQISETQNVDNYIFENVILIPVRQTDFNVSTVYHYIVNIYPYDIYHSCHGTAVATEYKNSIYSQLSDKQKKIIDYYLNNDINKIKSVFNQLGVVKTTEISNYLINLNNKEKVSINTNDVQIDSILQYLDIK
ncbi:MAG: hypothetical protein HXX16_12365 [Bacteroidales bacterium]|nr:hypothetical protein [Bacteroidales bacterium]